MSNRHRFDEEKHNRKLAKKEFEAIARKTHVRIAQNTDEVIRIVTDWKETGVVPNGMTVPALTALSEVNYVRINVASVLQTRKARAATAAHANGNGAVKKPEISDVPLLTEAQIRERSEATRKAGEFVTAFIGEIASAQELESWSAAENPFAPKPGASELEKIAAMYSVVSQNVMATAILKARYPKIAWDTIVWDHRNIRTLPIYARMSVSAEAVAKRVGMDIVVTPPPEPKADETTRPPSPIPFMNRLPHTVQDVLEELGLVGNLQQYHRVYTTRTGVRIPKEVAQSFAVAVDYLREDGDAEGLAALQGYFTGLPWDFVEKFTQTAEIAKPKPPAQSNGHLSVTEKFMQAGLLAQQRKGSTVTKAASAVITAEATEDVPAVSLSIEERIAALIERDYSEEEKRTMAEVRKTEDSMLEPLLELERILEDADHSPETNARILSLIQAYTQALMHGIVEHGTEKMEPYMNLTEGTAFATNVRVREPVIAKIDAVLEQADAHTQEATETPADVASDTENAAAVVPLSEHDPRLADLEAVLAKMDAAKRAECDALLRSLTKPEDREGGRIPSRDKVTCVLLVDLLHGHCDIQLLLDYMKIKGDRLRSWRKKDEASTAPEILVNAGGESADAKPADAAPVTAVLNARDFLDMITDAAVRAQCEALLPSVEHLARRKQGRVSVDKQRDALRMLSLLPPEAAKQFYAYLKIDEGRANTWRQIVGALGTAAPLVAAAEAQDTEGVPEAAPVHADSLQSLLALVTDTALLAECESLLPSLERAAQRTRGPVSTEGQKSILRMLEILPPEAAEALLALVKVEPFKAQVWKDLFGTIGTKAAPVVPAKTEAYTELPGNDQSGDERQASQEDVAEPVTDEAHEAVLTGLVAGFQGETRRACLELLQTIPQKKTGNERRHMTDEEKKNFLTASAYLAHVQKVGEMSEYFGVFAPSRSEWRKKFPNIAVTVPESDLVVDASDIPAEWKEEDFPSAALLASFPFLENVRGKEVLEACAQAARLIVFPPVEPGVPRSYPAASKMAFLRLLDLMKPFKSGQRVKEHYGVCPQNVINWRGQNLEESVKGQSASEEAAVQDTETPGENPAAGSVQPSTGTRVERNGYAPKNNIRPSFLADIRRSAQTEGAEPKKKKKTRPDAVKKLEVNQFVPPPAAVSVEEFESQQTDGFSRGKRLVIVRKALAIAAGVAQNKRELIDALYAEHKVDAATVIRWKNVYKDLLRQNAPAASDMATRPEPVRETKKKMLALKPSELSPFVTSAMPIFLSPFSAHGVDEDRAKEWGIPLGKVERQLKQFIGGMNVLPEEDVTRLRSIIQTPLDKTSIGELEYWSSMLALRFGMPESPMNKRLFAAMLDAIRNPKKIDTLREVALIAFN